MSLVYWCSWSLNLFSLQGYIPSIHFCGFSSVSLLDTFWNHWFNAISLFRWNLTALCPPASCFRGTMLSSFHKTFIVSFTCAIRASLASSRHTVMVSFNSAISMYFLPQWYSFRLPLYGSHETILPSSAYILYPERVKSNVSKTVGYFRKRASY